MAFEEITTLIPLALESGKIALNYQDKLKLSFKPDRSVVTQADKEVEDLIIRHVKALNPSYQVLGEETSGDQNKDFFFSALNGTCFVVDPIDGTAPYSNRLPTWGVSIGVMEEGELTQGIIYLAGLGEIFFTQGTESFMAKVSNPESDPVLGEKIPLLPAPKTLAPGQMIALSQRIARRGTYELNYPFQMTGSTVFALAKMAQGCYGAYSAQLCLWDYAAGWPILKNLGYALEFQNLAGELPSLDKVLKGPGNTSPWNTRDTLIFAPPGIISDIRSGMNENL